jgi:hypothetical protein
MFSWEEFTSEMNNLMSGQLDSEQNDYAVLFGLRDTLEDLVLNENRVTNSNITTTFLL